MDSLKAYEALGLTLQVLSGADSAAAQPLPGQRITVMYTGRLDDAHGKVFDSNEADGKEPLTVRLGRRQVISGWDVAFPHVRCGQRVRLTVPSGLAYGAKGKPPLIPPDATLCFDVVLTKIEVDTPGDELHDAASQGDVHALMRALASGASAAHVDRKGASALHAAASAGHAECVMRLLEAGVYTLDVNAVQTQPQGVTPLMLAVRAADATCIQLLITAKANAEQQSAKGNSAISMVEKDAEMRSVVSSAIARQARGPSAPEEADHELGIGERMAPGWEPMRCRALWLSRMRSANPRCWLKLVCEAAAGSAGRNGAAVRDGNDGVLAASVPIVEIELWADVVPRTAENFRCLCTGERGACAAFGAPPLHFKGNVAHRIVPGQILQAGDITSGDGKGGESIYGRKFDDESFGGRAGRHRAKGLLSMANSGKNSNGSQFFFTLGEMSHLDGKHVVFGRVVSGIEYVEAIASAAGAPTGVPTRRVVIADCGEHTE